MEGYITETKRRHNRESPVKTSNPTIFPSLVEHERVKENAVQSDQAKKKTEKFGKQHHISFGCLILEEKE